MHVLAFLTLALLCLIERNVRSTAGFLLLLVLFPIGHFHFRSSAVSPWLELMFICKGYTLWRQCHLPTSPVLFLADANMHSPLCVLEGYQSEQTNRPKSAIAFDEYQLDLVWSSPTVCLAMTSSDLCCCFMALF